MTDTANKIPIMYEQNVQLIIKSTPEAYDSNSKSCALCGDYGRNLLDEIRKSGMSDDLDRRCADYIEKAKRTLKAMNERRSPVTKLFDLIRAEFTVLENSVDPAKKDTIPYQIQQQRNAYAAKKREEEERARQEELRKQRQAQALSRYTQEAEDDYRRQFDAKVTADINALTSLNQSLTVGNFDEVSEKVKDFKITLGNEWFQQLQSYAHKPFEITDADAIQIRQSVLSRLSKQFGEQYASEVGEYRDTIADALPAKRRELERMAKADAEEQARIKADLEAREAAEASRVDEARKRKEAEADAARQMKQKAAVMDDLFAQTAAAAPAGYQPKTAVKKRIVAEKPDGILAIVSMWWSKEGKFLPIEELAKIFKKQITWCEKLANDKNNPELISSPFIRYEDEVKAK